MFLQYKTADLQRLFFLIRGFKVLPPYVFPVSAVVVTFFINALTIVDPSSVIRHYLPAFPLSAEYTLEGIVIG